MQALRRLYGEHPLHLLAVLATFAVAAVALARLRDAGPLGNLTFWLAGAIVVHDLVLYPLYAVVDRMAVRLGPGRPGDRPASGAINYLRIPTLLSGLLLLLFFPLILGLAKRYELYTAVGTDVFLERWLWMTAALFVGSALLYAGRRLRAGGRGQSAP